MKILFNHAESFEFSATKPAIKEPDELSEKTSSASCSNALVSFIAVEKADEAVESAVVARALEEIKEVAEKLATRTVVIYPYAHLSSELSSPAVARRVFEELTREVSAAGYETIRAPFGWYKSFKISGKGHPLAELSRKIIIEEHEVKSDDKKEVSEALKAEEAMKSSWAILDTDGTIHPITVDGNKIMGFDFKGHENLKRFAEYELSKNRAVDRAPPHVALMQKLELVDYEPGSDPGNLRYYPKGRLIKSLLEDYVTSEVKDYGAMEIEAPIMYDFEHKSLKKYLNRFPARQYTIQTPNKKVFLRFAACFGQFLMAHDATISHKDLPMRLYEMTRYSFRVEKRGELTGLRRLRSFTMPDCHAFVTDFEMAKEEMKRRFVLSERILSKIGIDRKNELEMGLRVVSDFYDEHKDFVGGLISEWGKPVLVEMWDSRFFYFVMKYEWNFIDCLNKASALTTDQIDVENAKTYDITYVDSDGFEKNPLIMHLSPSGAIERVIYALLERASKRMERGETASLPLWLSPTQVRVIPVSEKNFAYANEICDSLNKSQIRADLDDRDLTLGKKIREAGGEWVPYVVVIGDKEADGGPLSVRIRGQKEQINMSLEDLEVKIKDEVCGMPYKSLPLPKRLSTRPKFVG